ncbi:MAG: M15 family metallopeptidase [Pseudomonadota bacterium]
MPVARTMRRLAISMLLAAAPAAAQGVQPGFGPDGRYYGHLPYAELPNAARAALAQTLSPDKSCELHRDAAAALYRLTDAARLAGIQLRLISCFRTTAHQQTLFCGAGAIGPCRDPTERARSVAPGGYSEHVTGYAVDFGTPSPAGCGDLDPCMAGTPGGLWLAANAPRFGFELSFPPGNAQGVTWEPWHWRWVGTDPAEPGATAARAAFARARSGFPARPAVRDAAPPAVRLKPVDPRTFTGPRD